jgi:adenosylmethionine-8-amino-7-oxononanoate aminotransferase
MTALIYPTSDLNQTERLRIEKGNGVYVYDENGKQYLEAMAGLWCTSLGYGNEELADAAKQQILDLSYAHLFGGKSHPLAEKLADTLAEMVPVPNARVFLGTSGSDANDTQIKLLQYYFNGIGKPSKKKLISRSRAYHGVSVAASTLTGLPATHAGFDVPFEALGIIRVEAPHYYRQGLPGESETEFSDRLLEELEATINTEGADNIAAMIIEPIPGAGGVIVPPADYYPRVQQLLNANDIMLWDDEVICGFGRTGTAFGAETFDFKPDMMSFAKGLSSGYQPISAAVVRGDIYDAIAESSREHGVFGHGYTYSGHPVACAVALKTLEIYKRDNVFNKAAATGEYLQSKLRQFDQHPLIGEVRGKGLIAALEIVADKSSARPFTDPSIGYFAQARCEANGLISRCVGGNNLALCPPLVITEQGVDEIIDKLRISLDETLDHVTKNSIS